MFFLLFFLFDVIVFLLNFFVVGVFVCSCVFFLNQANFYCEIYITLSVFFDDLTTFVFVEAVLTMANTVTSVLLWQTATYVT